MKKMRQFRTFFILSALAISIFSCKKEDVSNPQQEGVTFSIDLTSQTKNTLEASETPSAVIISTLVAGDAALIADAKNTSPRRDCERRDPVQPHAREPSVRPGSWHPFRLTTLQLWWFGSVSAPGVACESGTFSVGWSASWTYEVRTSDVRPSDFGPSGLRTGLS